jgi:hypothetical protein
MFTYMRGFYGSPEEVRTPIFFFHCFRQPFLTWEFKQGLQSNASCGLSIRPKSKISKVDQLKTIIEAWGMNPNEILSKNALTMPHATIVDPEQEKIETLNRVLKQAIVKEIQKPKRYMRAYAEVARERFELPLYFYFVKSVYAVLFNMGNLNGDLNLLGPAKVTITNTTQRAGS